jgi:hypothetical protein
MNHKYDASNPERIRYWIMENIHMVWDQVARLQKIQDKGFVLRVVFYEGSWSIVCQ